MIFHFKCNIDINNREDLPDVLYEIITDLRNTEMYPDNYKYETLADGHYESEWSVCDDDDEGKEARSLEEEEDEDDEYGRLYDATDVLNRGE